MYGRHQSSENSLCKKSNKSSSTTREVFDNKTSRFQKIRDITSAISVVMASIGTIFGSAPLATLMTSIAAFIITIKTICASSTAVYKVMTKKAEKQVFDLVNVKNDLKKLKSAISTAMKDGQ